MKFQINMPLCGQFRDGVLLRLGRLRLHNTQTIIQTICCPDLLAVPPNNCVSPQTHFSHDKQNYNCALQMGTTAVGQMGRPSKRQIHPRLFLLTNLMRELQG